MGPFQAQGGYYLIQVEKVTPAETTPLDEVSQQIKQQLSQGVQQQAVSDLQADFLAKWVQRSFCASDYVMDQCANFTPPDSCNGDDSKGESGNLDKTRCARRAPVFPDSRSRRCRSGHVPRPAGPELPGGRLAQAPSPRRRSPGCSGPAARRSFRRARAPQTAPQAAP